MGGSENEVSMRRKGALGWKSRALFVQRGSRQPELVLSTLPTAGGWSSMTFKVAPNLSHSMSMIQRDSEYTLRISLRRENQEPLGVSFSWEPFRLDHCRYRVRTWRYIRDI